MSDTGFSLTKDQIKDMKPNVPTRRVFGTDASLGWPEQLEFVRKACSKAITRLSSMLDSASEGSEVAEIVRALATAQTMAIKATVPGQGGEHETAPSDAQLIKAAK